MHTPTYIHIHIHICINIYECIYIYTCLYLCIYIGSTTRPENKLRDMNTIGPPVCHRPPPNTSLYIHI